MDSFSNRLRTLLNEKNMTAVALSKACGISTSTLSQYLSGKYNPKSDRIELLADYFDCNPLWLAGKNVSPLKEPSCDNLLPVFSDPPEYSVPHAAALFSEPAESRYCDSEHYYLSVNDNALAPCIEKEDIVLIERCSRITTGELGLFVTEGSLWSIRELLDNTNGLYLGFHKSSGCLPFLITDDRLESTKIIGKVLKIVKTWHT